MIALRPVWLVARREIRIRVQSRAFLLSTALLVVLAVAAVVAVRLLPGFFEDEPLRIGLVPEAAEFQKPLRNVSRAYGVEVQIVSLASRDEARRAFDSDDLDAVVASRSEILFQGARITTIESMVAQAAFELALPERAQALGLTLEQARTLIQPERVQTSIIDPAQEGPSADARGLASLTTVLLLMAMSLYGQWVLVGVIEEKSNRVVEVLLAAVTPVQLLMGKVLGILALAVGQIALLVGALLIALAVAGEDVLPPVEPWALAMSLGWLVLGLLLYNFLYAAIGSTVSRPEEASSVAFPVLLPLLAGYFAGLVYIPAQPDAILSRLLSLFPLTAPLTMPARVVSGGGSPLESALAMLLTAGAIAGVIWMGARIYTGAILQTQRVGLLSAFRNARNLR